MNQSQTELLKTQTEPPEPLKPYQPLHPFHPHVLQAVQSLAMTRLDAARYQATRRAFVAFTAASGAPMTEAQYDAQCDLILTNERNA